MKWYGWVIVAGVLSAYVLAAALCRASADADRRLAEMHRRRLQDEPELTDEQVQRLWDAMHEPQPPRRRHYR